MSIRAKLSIMMFLEFFIWGAWLPLIFGYLPSLEFNATQTSWILNAFALASFTGMFFSNQFADRNFSAEKFMAVSHLIGGLAIMALGWTTSYWPFFILMLIHCLFYVPTISIANSISFANLKDPLHDFGPVRLWGTIGWIAASWPFVFILVDWSSVPAMADVGFVSWLGTALGTAKTGEALKEATTWTFITAGIASLLLAGFSLTLPHTPPKPAKADDDQFAWMSSVKLLAVPFVLVLFIVTFIDAAVHQCYFLFTNDYLKSVGIPANWVMPVMSIGQIAEIGTMAILGLALKRLGWRTTMVIGILGHAVRFGVFALCPYPVPTVLVILLHGICYAFFFAAVYIFVDEFFSKDARTSAQGLFNFLIFGLGPFVANNVWPYIGDQLVTVQVKAEVVYEAGDPSLVLKGLVLQPVRDMELLSVRNTRLAAEESESKEGETQAIAVKVDDKHQIDATFEGLKPGKYVLSFDTVEKHMLAGDRDLEVKVAIEVPEKQPEKGKEATAVVKIFDFEKLFLFPSGTALVAAMLLALFFHPPAIGSSDGKTGAGPPH